MEIVWTLKGKSSYLDIIKSVNTSWGFNVVLKLETAVNETIEHLKTNKHLCPASKSKKGLRKCVISKQTSMLYRVKSNKIELILFISNKSNHNY